MTCAHRTHGVQTRAKKETRADSGHILRNWAGRAITELLTSLELALHLMLTTFAGEEIQLTIELQEFDRLNEFENAVLEQLPYLGESSTFGCELQFVHKDTHKVLVDPIWNTLRETTAST